MSEQAQEVTMQQLIDGGINAFALQLLVESILAKKDAETFTPFTFSFRGILFTLAPDPHRPLDGRHH
jgi:hypothetical protein